jgi:hypothetical protein
MWSQFAIVVTLTGKRPEPNDVDIFMLMSDALDLSVVSGEARILFDHSSAQAHFGASVFWLRRLSTLPSEEDLLAGWQVKRDGSQRGIVEVIGE